MNKKLILSECCNSNVQHFPADGLDPMNNVIFFCNKCGKPCKTKFVKEENKQEESK